MGGMGGMERMGGGSLEMPAMELGKRVWMVQSYPFHMLMKSLRDMNHGDAWEYEVLCRSRRWKGSMKHAVTRIGVKWTGAREYLL